MVPARDDNNSSAPKDCGTSTPAISVVICVHNAGPLLAEQLSALAPQLDDADAELVIVNNLCTDESMQIARSFQSRISRLRIVDAAQRRSKAYAVNCGVRAARSDKVALTDADDVVGPVWLAAMLEGLQHHDVVTGPIETHSLSGDCPVLAEQPNWSVKPQLGFLPFMCGSNRAFKKSAYDFVGGVDEQLSRGEDLDFSWRLQLAGIPIHFAEGALVHYRVRSDGAANWRMLAQNAAAHVGHYARFAKDGMPRRPLKGVLKRYRIILRLGRRYPRLSPPERIRLLRESAVAWGHLVGSLRHRRLYL